MIVIYHRKTGEIIASFPEVYQLDPSITVCRGDDPRNYEQLVLSPEEARDFEDPRHPKNIHDYQVKLSRGKPKGLVRKV